MRQGDRGQVSGTDCFWGEEAGKGGLPGRTPEAGVSGDPFPRSLPLPEGEAGSQRRGHVPLWAPGWVSPAEPETWAAATLGPLM